MTKRPSVVDHLELRTRVLSRNGAISTTEIDELLAAGPSGFLPAVLEVIDPALVFCDSAPAEVADARTASDRGRLDLIALAERQAGWIHAVAATFTASFAATATYGPAGERPSRFNAVRATVVNEVALVLGIAPPTADARIGSAMLLNPAGPLADTHAALASGRITRWVAEAVADYTWDLTAEQISRVQGSVLPKLLRHVDAVTGEGCPASVGTARKLISRWVARIAPETVANKQAKAHVDRGVKFRALADGMCQITAFLPTLEAAATMAAIDALGDVEVSRDAEAQVAGAQFGHTCHLHESACPATGIDVRGTIDRSGRSRCTCELSVSDGQSAGPAKLSVSDGHSHLPTECTTCMSCRACSSTDAIRTPAQARADAFVAALQNAAQHVADGGVLPSHHGRMRLTIGVHMTVDQLLALRAGACEIPGIGALDPELARILSADNAWQQFIHQPLTGELLDAGADTYSPSRAMRDFLIARDRTCTFPGCHQPAHRSQFDHITPWPDGSTTRANLHALCVHHHNLKTHAQWRVHRDFDEPVTHWQTPRGLSALRTSPHSDLIETRVPTQVPLPTEVPAPLETHDKDSLSDAA